jgi:general secretion pathway protein G
MRTLATRDGMAAEPPNRKAAGQGGFTLIELLIVLAILSLLAAIAAPRFMKYLGSAKVQTAQLQVKQLGTVLDLYHLEVGRYPTDQEGLKALVEKPSGVESWNGPYLKSRDSLTDPWGHPYGYRSPGQHGEYDLFSMGADGQEGGDNENKDIQSWN